MRQRVRNPKRGEERRGEFALTGTKRKKRKEKRKKGRRKKGRRRGRKAWKLVQWLCVSWAPSSLSNTPSNIPSAITYSLLYTPILPPYVTIFYNSYLSTDLRHVRKGVETHTYVALFPFRFVRIVKSILQIYQQHS